MLTNSLSSTVSNEAVADSAAQEAVCYGRVGLLEFGPFTLPELTELTASHALPDDMELRIDSDELWWSWPRIIAGVEAASDPSPDCFRNWFTRVDEAIAGPFTIVDLSTLLLSGGLPPTVEVQIGDGPWRPVIELLVPAEESVPIAATVQLESLPAQATTVEPCLVDPPVSTVDRQKAELEHFRGYFAVYPAWRR